MKSLKTVLTEYTKKYGTSKPVFELTLSDDGGSFDGELKEKYDPTTESMDPIENMLQSSYSESFDRDKCRYVVNSDGMVRNAVNRIDSAFLGFLDTHLGIKKPKQSKLYIFVEETLLDCHKIDTDRAILILELYRYLCINKEEISTIVDSVHTRNVLSILNTMKEEHEARSPKVNRR